MLHSHLRTTGVCYSAATGPRAPSSSSLTKMTGWLRPAVRDQAPPPLVSPHTIIRLALRGRQIGSRVPRFSSPHLHTCGRGCVFVCMRVRIIHTRAIRCLTGGAGPVPGARAPRDPSREAQPLLRFLGSQGRTTGRARPLVPAVRRPGSPAHVPRTCCLVSASQPTASRCHGYITPHLRQACVAPVILVGIGPYLTLGSACCPVTARGDRCLSSCPASTWCRAARTTA
jgi:hypothetical protein